MAKKKTSKNIPLPILILICAVLLFAMYLSLSTLALAIWGDSVMGTVDSYDSRLDDTKAEQNRSRTVSKGYWFMVNSKEYRGYVIYSSDEAWPRLDKDETRSERIRYLDVFPYVNKPAALCEFGEMGEVAIIYHILAPIGYLLLLLLVTPVAFIIDYNLANMELNSWRNGTTLEWGRLLLCAAISFVLIGLMIAIGISIPARKAMKVQPAEALHDE